MTILEQLERNWSLIMVWVGFLLLLVFILEYRHWKSHWNYLERPKYHPLEDWEATFQDYLKWWGLILTTTADKLVMKIHHNFVDLLESQYPELKATGFARKGLSRGLPFLPKVYDEELRRFLVDPAAWIQPHLEGKENLFGSGDRENLFLGYAELLPIFRDLHNRISSFSERPADPRWDEIESLFLRYRKEVRNKRKKTVARIFGIYLTILFVFIFSQFPFAGDFFAPFILALLLATIVFFLFTFTEFFQRLSGKKSGVQGKNQSMKL